MIAIDFLAFLIAMIFLTIFINKALETNRAKKCIRHVFTICKIKSKERRLIFNVDISLDHTQYAEVILAPTDEDGAPGEVDSIEWASEAAEVAVEFSSDGLKAHFIPNDGFVGVGVVRAKADVDLGEGIETIEAVFNLSVSSPKVTNLNPAFTVGEKSSRPPLG